MHPSQQALSDTGSSRSTISRRLVSGTRDWIPMRTFWSPGTTISHAPSRRRRSMAIWMKSTTRTGTCCRSHWQIRLRIGRKRSMMWMCRARPPQSPRSRSFYRPDMTGARVAGCLQGAAANTARDGGDEQQYCCEDQRNPQMPHAKFHLRHISSPPSIMVFSGAHAVRCSDLWS